MAERGAIELAGASLAGGGHICAFFNDREEEFKVLLPFIMQGLQEGDRVSLIVGGPPQGGALERLRRAGVDLESALGRGQLAVWSWDEAYLRGGRFDQDAMLALIRQILEEGKARGYPRTRVVADMEWALAGLPGTHDVVKYASRLNELLERYPDLVECTYDSTRFGGRIVIDVLRTHPVALVGGTVHQNPFYVPPGEFLKELSGHAP